MKPNDNKQSNFIDTARIYVKAGDGGNGCLSFRREKFVPFGGPNGGNGGNGGDIYLQADRNITTLIELAYHPHVRGNNGEHGRGSNKFGKNGEDKVLSVPCGTIIKRGNKVIYDLSEHGEKMVIAKGGRGGRGNAAFKTRFNTAPYIAEKGEQGEDFTYNLELKVLADVGLVGFPNAGKSTFLSVVSNARPKIADYPFTTLSPNLGIVYHKKNSFVVADIPGLIEGAHAGKGLGATFLKHIERTRVILHFVDPQGFKDFSPSQSITAVKSELKKFSKELAKKPYILAVTKADLPESKEVWEKIQKRYKVKNVFFVSSATGYGISKLLDETIKLLKENPTPIKTPVEKPKKEPGFHKVEQAFIVTRTKAGLLEIKGKDVKRLVDMTNFEQPEAVIRLRNILRRMGVEKALTQKGVSEGETVVIAGREFTWTYSFDEREYRRQFKRPKSPSR
jgi:GTPase